MNSGTPIVLLDTSVLINFMHGKPKARALLRELGLGGVILAVSCITVAEIYGGIRPGEEQATQRLLSSLDIFPVSIEIAQEAGLIRSAQRRLGRTFSLDDMMIAATAILHGCVLVTDNRKDFEIPKIELFPEY